MGRGTYMDQSQSLLSMNSRVPGEADAVARMLGLSESFMPEVEVIRCVSIIVEVGGSVWGIS